MFQLSSGGLCWSCTFRVRHNQLKRNPYHSILTLGVDKQKGWRSSCPSNVFIVTRKLLLLGTYYDTILVIWLQNLNKKRKKHRWRHLSGTLENTAPCRFGKEPCENTEPCAVLQESKTGSIPLFFFMKRFKVHWQPDWTSATRLWISKHSYVPLKTDVPAGKLLHSVRFFWSHSGKSRTSGKI